TICALVSTRPSCEMKKPVPLFSRAPLPETRGIAPAYVAPGDAGSLVPLTAPIGDGGISNVQEVKLATQIRLAQQPRRLDETLGRLRRAMPSGGMRSTVWRDAHRAFGRGLRPIEEFGVGAADLVGRRIGIIVGLRDPVMDRRLAFRRCRRIVVIA